MSKPSPAHQDRVPNFVTQGPNLFKSLSLSPDKSYCCNIWLLTFICRQLFHPPGAGVKKYALNFRQRTLFSFFSNDGRSKAAISMGELLAPHGITIFSFDCHIISMEGSGTTFMTSSPHAHIPTQASMLISILFIAWLSFLLLFGSRSHLCFPSFRMRFYNFEFRRAESDGPRFSSGNYPAFRL